MKLKIIMKLSEIIGYRLYCSGFHEGYHLGYSSGKSDAIEDKCMEKARILWKFIRRRLNFTQGDQYGTWKTDMVNYQKKQLSFLMKNIVRSK